MSVIAFIPVRCGSKSIPFKNIKEFCGKPLVYWNVKALEECAMVSQIIVATDCNAIEDAVRSFGFNKTKVYRRKAENAQDTSSTESVMLEYLEGEGAECKAEDLFVLVQATSPLTQTQDFDAALKSYHEEKVDSLLSCIRLKRFFWSADGKPLNYDFTKRPRRQDFDGILTENGAFYINKVGNILRDRCRLSGKVGIHEMPEFTAVEIDEEQDWLLAEALMQKYILSKNEVRPTIKLFATDVDGVLTDAGMYYSENGDELKKFNTRDGKGLELVRNSGIKTAIVTTEVTKLVERRAGKLKVDFLYQGRAHGGKLDAIKEICEQIGCSLQEVAYIGDDVNCMEVLKSVGWAACPADAVDTIKNLPQVHVMTKRGGEGVVREFIEHILTGK